MQARQKEEREKHELEKQAQNAEIESLKTRHMFLMNDYEEVLRKNKALERNVSTAADDTGKRAASPMTTPRKKKLMLHRDGFDDNEIVVVSPKKSKGTTPVKKRKRLHSGNPPLAVLPLSQSRKAPFIEGSKNLVVDEELLQRLWQSNHKFDVCKARAHNMKLLTITEAV